MTPLPGLFLMLVAVQSESKMALSVSLVLPLGWASEVWWGCPCCGIHLRSSSVACTCHSRWCHKQGFICYSILTKILKITQRDKTLTAQCCVAKDEFEFWVILALFYFYDNLFSLFVHQSESLTRTQHEREAEEHKELWEAEVRSRTKLGAKVRFQ